MIAALDTPSSFAPEITDRTIFHVGVSGGKDSVATLLFLKFESGIDPSKIRASCADTKNEHKWTEEHIKLVSENVHPIEILEPDLGFFDLAFHKKRFPSAVARFCTQHLKIIPAQRHITNLIAEGHEVIAVSGVRADESAVRASLPEWDYSGHMLCVEWRPLIHWTLADVLAIHKRHNIPLNPLYAAGAQRVGCWPCVMSRKAEIRNIAINFPDRIDDIRAAEQRFETAGRSFSSFFGPNVTPKRFHSKTSVNKKGEIVSYATIDDVVRWSLTGKGAKGSFKDEPEPESRCMSGYCE